ncbi:alpha/beta hydrolase fold protein [Infundibulicybe gibba]|nr:alpha/beta hydrolase fold protein [Infundibulicybe gibba]
MADYPELPSTVVSRTLSVGDLDVHILESCPSQTAPLLILLHGFPELAYSWRKIIAPLAAAGYHVVAPDQRGYGRTRSADPAHAGPVAYDDDLTPYAMPHLAGDIVALVHALGYTTAVAIGHDFGASLAGSCALVRPDIFRAVVMMSAPFTGPPPASPTEPRGTIQQLDAALARLDPPRKHYTMYFSTPSANTDMLHAPQGLRAFLRTYYHAKSADWAHNIPHPLGALSAAALAEMPPYYIMPLRTSMPDAITACAPTPGEVARNTWLTEDELGVYVAAYTAVGFQGGLNRYRCLTSPAWVAGLRVFAGKGIEVPAMFLGGAGDWGVWQYPGAAEAMREKVCLDMREEDFVIVPGAGHWVQQEKPEAVVDHLLRFLGRIKGSPSLVVRSTTDYTPRTGQR